MVDIDIFSRSPKGLQLIKHVLLTNDKVTSGNKRVSPCPKAKLFQISLDYTNIHSCINQRDIETMKDRKRGGVAESLARDLS